MKQTNYSYVTDLQQLLKLMPSSNICFQLYLRAKTSVWNWYIIQQTNVCLQIPPLPLLPVGSEPRWHWSAWKLQDHNAYIAVRLCKGQTEKKLEFLTYFVTDKLLCNANDTIRCAKTIHQYGQERNTTMNTIQTINSFQTVHHMQWCNRPSCAPSQILCTT